MKKLILTLVIASFIGCEKDEDTKPAGINSENVEQYVGWWTLNVPTCTVKTFRIDLGSEKNELIFDGMKGIVKDKSLTVSNPVKHWKVDFVSDRFAMVNYNFGSCVGGINKR